MPMVGDVRAAAVYAAVSASNPNFSKLSADEKATLLDGFKAIYGADTTYIQTNALVTSAGAVTTGAGTGGAVVATGTVA